MIRAVLDANVLASGITAIRNRESTPGALMRLWQARAFELVLSEPLLAEVVRSLRDPYFRRRLSPAKLSRAAALLRFRSTLIPLTVSVSGVATHPEDDVILATASSAGVDHLVTGDQKLQRLGTYQCLQILSPRDFLDLLDQEQRGKGG